MFNTPPQLGKAPSAMEQRCISYKAYFQLTSEKRLRVSFLKRHLPKDVIQTHFGKNHFEMPFALELPLVVLAQLGIESYKIHSGYYPVQEDADFIKIDF